MIVYISISLWNRMVLSMREFRYAWKRALPFVMFGRRAISPTIHTLGATLPFAIMAVLVVYCLKSIPTGSLKENLELIAAVLLVAGLHLTKKNTVLSISVGTVFYMVLVHVV